MRGKRWGKAERKEYNKILLHIPAVVKAKNEVVFLPAKTGLLVS